MNLELALVISCTNKGCLVRTVNGDELVETCYSALVQDRIKIKPDQLVAIDKSVDPPEIMWRWVSAIVDRIEDERILVSDGKCTLISHAIVHALNLDLEPDDDVWVCNVGHDFEVHDNIVRGKPEHPERLLAYIEPTIISTYKEETTD
jgi:hypothetical protein